MPPQTPWHTTGHTPDPLWPVFAHVLRRDGHVTFRMLDRMPHIPGVIDPDALAMVDKDNNVIAVCSSLDDGELRACIGHELFHLMDPDADEAEVEHRTARAMVPLSAALAARTPAEVDLVARALWVDQKLIASRLASDADEIPRQAAS